MKEENTKEEIDRLQDLLVTKDKEIKKLRGAVKLLLDCSGKPSSTCYARDILIKGDYRW